LPEVKVRTLPPQRAQQGSARRAACDAALAGA
jgi:hypothetical protein